MIGAASNASTVSLLFKSRPTRVVTMRQKRRINDYPLPGWLAERLIPGIVTNWIVTSETSAVDLPVLCADGTFTKERDRQGMLRGRIFYMPLQESAAEIQLQEASLQSIENILEDCRSRSVEQKPTAEQALQDLNGLVEQCVEASGHFVKLELALFRTGECRIWYEELPRNMRDRELDLIAHQAYYFIKDAVHVHSYHDPSSDQITPLTLDEPQPQEDDYSHEVAWRRETLWSLSREVERLNRDKRITNQRRSLGIIAYAEAFQASLMGHERDPKSPGGFRKTSVVHDYDFTHLKDSIRAEIDVNATEIAQRSQLWVAAIATAISLVALFSSLIATHNASLPRLLGKVSERTVSVGVPNGILPLIGQYLLPAAIGVASLLVILLNLFAFRIEWAAYNRVQRFLSQLARSIASTCSDEPTRQFWIDLGLHAIMAVLSTSLFIACMWLIFGR